MAPDPSTRSARQPGASLAELSAEAAYAHDRVRLYRRRVTLGRGDPSRLRELERVADGASDRLTRRHAAHA